MKLNIVEFAAMNNPIRALIQDCYEVKKLRAMSDIGGIERALEIGCGNGYGTRLIKKYFKPAKLFAIDIDERMIKIAKKRNRDTSIVFEVQDAARLKFPDKYFDVIFDFGIIHHIQNWKECVRETARVLKDGGEIIFEDLSKETFETPSGKIMRYFSSHPYDTMYNKEEFIGSLKGSGFTVLNFEEANPFKLIKYFSLIAKKK